MSTTQLYRAFGCSHYSPLDCHQEYSGFPEMTFPPEKDRCSGCGSRDVIRRRSRQRQVAAPPLTLQGQRPTNPFLPGSVAWNPVSSGFQMSPDEVVHERVGAVVA
jgi:hypothetical protein